MERPTGLLLKLSPRFEMLAGLLRRTGRCEGSGKREWAGVGNRKHEWPKKKSASAPSCCPSSSASNDSPPDHDSLLILLLNSTTGGFTIQLEVTNHFIIHHQDNML